MTIIKNLRSVISLIDQLRDCGIESKISLPRIAVIGTQSAGKSSLLESIVGYDFLPRGDGVVTRRPLELRLCYVPQESFEPYGIFEDEKDIKLEDFQKIKERIEEKTNEVAGGKKNIVDEAIILSVYSNDCPNLTLIDLPGITRVPLKNSDQPEDIEKVTKDMTMKYITDPRTIILCVIPANTDISTSDALDLARKVDKEGARTLGVLTKIDIMDKGASAVSVLKNEVISLRHGYVAVKSRSQDDIKKKMTVKEALVMEEQYFINHMEYKNYIDQVGTQVLSQKLTTLLHEHIVTCLPSIEDEIKMNLESCKINVRELGEPFPNETGSKLFFLMEKSQKVSKLLNEIMEGKDLINSSKVTQFQGFSQFNLLISKFNKAKQKLFVEGLKETDVVDVILDVVQYKGISLPGFLPKEIIEKKVAGELDKLKIPIAEFISDVKFLNEEYLKLIFDKKMHNLANELKNLLKSISLDYLNKATDETTELIESLIEIDKGMIWTADFAYFLKEDPKNDNDSKEDGSTNGTQKYDKLEQKIEFIQSEIPGFGLEMIKAGLIETTEFTHTVKSKNYARLEQLKVADINITNIVSEEELVFFYDKLVRYYNILNRNLSDTITKIIGVKMIKSYSQGLETYFRKRISENLELVESLREDDGVVMRRNRYNDLYKKLQRSLDVLHKFNFAI